MSKFSWTLGLLCLATPVSADGNWTLGLGAVGSSGVYVGQDGSVEALPYIAYDTERFHVGIDGLSYQVYADDWGTLDVVLDYRSAPDFPTGDALFDGLTRDDAVEAGIAAEIAFGDVTLGFSALADVSDTHDGIAARTSVGYSYQLARMQFEAEVGALYQDANLNQYLYGVTAAEATADRATFTAQDTTTGFASLTAAYAITDMVFAVAEADYTTLGSNANSPLVEADEIYGLTLAIVTQF